MLQDSRLLRGAGIQVRTIRSLMLRDAMVRYGRDNIGFVWVILEPMILTAGVMAIWSLTIGSMKRDIKMVEFVLTGYMPLTLWRHMTNNSVTLFRRSSSLLYHRTISLFDITLSRYLLEFTATSAAFLVVWAPLYIAGVVAGVARLDELLLGWAMMGWLSAACGMILASVTENSETSERFVQPIQYLSIPISGAFAMVDWLPHWAQKALLWNPMVHCYEAVRGGYFGDSVVAHYSLPYFFACTSVLTFVGIACVRWIRPRVQLN
jgi:capsular polysaccharide transport system permease protein